ncbi:DUF664 domain-containing protein [Nocardioides mangrovicus]|uniref:DUF664 domain-containing protein n=1 Tax=Nocardioides mangrovicus TaxID=2478913 RepID=A0A3L8P1U7_9ACTN|nr:DUF664 domain-containing protein [Nocardioides mangrovicus]RLV49011.1 DUF664 domain-containing protein [Nocardioides mangrovicus]
MSAANDILLDAYDRVAESVPQLLDGLSTEAAAWRPAPGANSIGWLVWHLTRVLDDHLADVAGDPQVAVSQGFEERLGLDLPSGDTGYGHSSDDVAKVRFDDLGVLAEYHAAVQQQVAGYLARAEHFDRVVDERWDPPVTLSSRLVSVADDMARHIGQAQYVAGLWEQQENG